MLIFRNLISGMKDNLAYMIRTSYSSYTAPNTFLTVNNLTAVAQFNSSDKTV